MFPQECYRGHTSYWSVHIKDKNREIDVSILRPSNLLAVVSEDLEKTIQDLRKIIQQVDVWDRLQNQDLRHGRDDQPGIRKV